VDDSEPVRIPIATELDLHAFAPADVPSVVDEYLHAFAPADIPSVVDEYLHAAQQAGLSEIRLIHGRGRGIQRGIVQALLERHPLVVEFWDDTAAHLGATFCLLTAASQKPKA